MTIYLALLNLAGGVVLLLWAIRAVRTGVQRSQENLLRQVLREGRGGRFRAAGVGTVAAVLLQSSTAVAVLAAGFSSSGALTPATGLAMMLGADLGSALVVQFLALDLHWLMPVLLVGGGALFFKGTSRRLRQSGRIVIGMALILMSLQMIGDATLPLRTASYLPTAVGYLKGDFVAAFIAAALFTWLVHSSVAAILMVVTFATQGVLPIELGVSLLLGANVGGGLVAVGLTRGGATAARQIALGNLLFRGIGALIALLGFHLLHLSIIPSGGTVARQIVVLHLAFNMMLLIACLPLTAPMARLTARLVGVGAQPDPLSLAPSSCLDAGVIDQPQLALASAKRELLRLAELVERMLQPVLEVYQVGDPLKIREIKRLEDAVDKSHADIKLYLSRIRYDSGAFDGTQRGQDLANFAANLEFAADSVVNTLLKLAKNRRERDLRFSPEGWHEICELHLQVMDNLHLALNVLISQDRDSARRLLANKDFMRAAERASVSGHLQRLRQGAAQSIDTSNIHLETVRAFKHINSMFASVAYPILSETGDLLESRLVPEASR